MEKTVARGRREPVSASLTSTAAVAPVETQLATDMARRAVLLAPAFVVAAALGWGLDGAVSALYAMALVVANLLAAAAMLGWAARRSLKLLAVVAMGGYALRLASVTLAVFAVKDHAWVELVPLGITVVICQLALLWWETRHLSLSLAFPALKPPPPEA